MKLHKVKEHTAKNPSWPNGTLGIYCGHLLCGWAIPTRTTGYEKYRFHSGPRFPFDMEPKTDFTLDEIKTNVELTIKEFLSTVIMNYKEEKL